MPDPATVRPVSDGSDVTDQAGWPLPPVDPKIWPVE